MYNVNNYDFVKNVIESSVKNFISNNDNTIFNSLGLKFYMSEYRTLKFGFPRQCGKTTSIANLYDRSDLIICRNCQTVTNLKNKYVIDCDVTSINNLNIIKNEPYRIVWVDDCNILTTDIIDKLIRFRLIDKNSLIVIIGN